MLAPKPNHCLPTTSRCSTTCDTAASCCCPCLSGAQSPLETLFPRGEFDLADGLYRRSATMRYINGLAASAVEALVAARGNVPLRVLEIGAGTGGTTAASCRCLPAERTRYRFTDVSPFFFDRAREGFAAFPSSSSPSSTSIAISPHRATPPAAST